MDRKLFAWPRKKKLLNLEIMYTNFMVTLMALSYNFLYQMSKHDEQNVWAIDF